MTTPTVSLTPAQLLTAAIGGVRRQVTNVHRRNAHGLEEWGFDWNEAILGAIGEVAVAKHFNRYWEAVVANPWTELKADVGKSLHVRTTDPGKRLIVRKSDPDDGVFVLVTGRRLEWTLVGWLLGWEAKQDRWWTVVAHRPPAWFVPGDELHPIGKLAI